MLNQSRLGQDGNKAKHLIKRQLLRALIMMTTTEIRQGGDPMRPLLFELGLQIHFRSWLASSPSACARIPDDVYLQGSVAEVETALSS